MKIRRNITKIASVILCAALLTVAMATSAFAAAPTESGMIDIAVSDSDASFVANHLDALETVRDGLSQYLEVLTSSFDAQKGKEAFYHGFVLGLTATLTGDYRIRSNRESGFGRYDIAAFPRKAGERGMVIECKQAESENALETKAQEALEQIKARDYDAEFRAQGIEGVLHYGISFCGKHVHVEMV